MRRNTWLVLVCLGSNACIMAQLPRSIAQAAETDDPGVGCELREIEATLFALMSEEQLVNPDNHR